MNLLKLQQAKKFELVDLEGKVINSMISFMADRRVGSQAE